LSSPNICVSISISISISRSSLRAHTPTQTEKAFQKQPTIFLAKRRLLGKKVKGTTRYYKNIGLGFKTPKTAITGHYIDKKCPFTSNVSIRGRIFRGTVVSTKMNRTVIVRRDYLHYIKKYNRYEKRHKNIPAHLSPAFKVSKGQVVTIGQCRYVSASLALAKQTATHSHVPPR